MIATYRYLLDTNIVSDLVRNPQGSVAGHIRSVGEEKIATSLIVEAEIRFGLKKLSNKLAIERIGQILNHIPILPLEGDVSGHYAEIRHSLEKRGLPIGPNDLLIAAHARSLGLVLVTDNVKEFNRVPRLKMENWLA